MLMHASLFRVPLDAVKSTFFTFSLPLHLGRQVQLNRKREKVKHLRVSVRVLVGVADKSEPESEQFRKD